MFTLGVCQWAGRLAGGKAAGTLCALWAKISPALRPGCCSSHLRRCGVHQAAIFPKCRAKALRVTTSYRHARLTCFLLCLFSLISSACNREGDQRKAELCLLSLHSCVFSFLFSSLFLTIVREARHRGSSSVLYPASSNPSPERCKEALVLLPEAVDRWKMLEVVKAKFCGLASQEQYLDSYQGHKGARKHLIML